MSDFSVYRLSDRYACDAKTVFLSGIQVLARLAIDQARSDRETGLRTAGMVTGYRGSPITALDREIDGQRDLFSSLGIRHVPALNEDLAVTALWGTQQLAQRPEREVEGVFGFWYGKGPGLDRSMDALRHAAAYGASSSGGVVLMVGDDHGASSSTVAHQSDRMLAAAHIPVLHPATLAELYGFGLAAMEISRRTGAWVALKCQTELLETSARIDLKAAQIALPDVEASDAEMLFARGSEPPLEAEKRHAPRLRAVQGLVHAAALDRIIPGSETARLGIMATGKAWLDLMAALDQMGLTRDTAGIRLYKPGLVWPLEPGRAAEFAKDLDRILVVEEKGPVAEDQLRIILSRRSERMPLILGKQDEMGAPLIPETGVIAPDIVARGITALIGRAQSPEPPAHEPPALPRRRPFFCAGCPHNTSTNLPEGSRAFAGIGCHSMAIGTGRATDDFTQMGAEGVTWQGQAPFTAERHVFANMGDGTYYHSGILAIRSAVAAGHNITYKILFNDAVAMTGGQAHDGALTPLDIVRQLKAEGVGRTVLVSKEPGQWRAAGLPEGAELLPRDQLDPVSRELRNTPGVTAIVYDQTCATELRRQRKRGTAERPVTRAFINPLVCEGCGDCTRVSNCVAVEPVETWQGQKRQINQSVCNIDLSCTAGFCPSFVTVTGFEQITATSEAVDNILAKAVLPDPAIADDGAADILIAGIGGTGVLTLSAVIGTAAFLENRPVTLLDQTGLAQKNGAVRSHIRLSRDTDRAMPSRIPKGGADLVLACDAFSGADPQVLAHIGRGRTQVLANATAAPPVEFLTDRTVDISVARALATLEDASGRPTERLDARSLALRFFGEAALANVILLGAAWQSGRVPLSLNALERAFELNGVAVVANLKAFALGRVAAAAPDLLDRALPEAEAETAPDLDQRIRFLTAYQNAGWAARYRSMVEATAAREAEVSGAPGPLTDAVTRNLFKLMAYKDEYEVARLHTDPEFTTALRETFGEKIEIRHHFAPPLLPLGKDHRGYPKKRAFPPWVRRLLPLLAAMKRLRGTPFDPFGYTAERRAERAMIEAYATMLAEELPRLTAERLDAVTRLAGLPDAVRGFGPIKEKAMEEMHQHYAEILEELRQTERPQPQPEKAAAGGAVQ